MPNENIDNAIARLKHTSRKYPLVNVKTPYGYVDARRVRDYWIYIKRHGIWAGTFSSNQLSLGFTVSDSKWAAGRVISQGPHDWLCHKGQLGGTNRAVPIERLLANIDGFPTVEAYDPSRLLVAICNVGDDGALERLRDFAAECNRIRNELFLVGSSEYSSSATPHESDPGPRGSGRKKECVWTARHSPICLALGAWLKQQGWSLPTQPIFMAPDLARIKSKRIALFEVKPESRSHDIICAIGQLIVYGHANRVEDLFIVCPSLEAANARFISSAANAHGIKFLFFEEKKGTYDFFWN